MPEWIDPLRKHSTKLDLGLRGKQVAEVGKRQDFSDESTPIYESVMDLFPALRHA